MAVQLNHTTVSVRDKGESATFLAEILGLDEPTPYGPFLVVHVDNDVSLDFADDHGPIHPSTTHSWSATPTSTRSSAGSVPAGCRIGPIPAGIGPVKPTPTTAAGACTGKNRAGTSSRAFLCEYGTLSEVGVEGSSSYGVGFAAVLQDNAILVREVSRPDRSQRRRHGKSDPIDAYQAARAVLDGRAGTIAKNQQIEQLRALLNARKSAVKAATAAMNQTDQMLVNAPTALREKDRLLKESPLVAALSSSRPGTARSDHRPHLFA